MKTLFLVRHAKSSWKEPGLADKDRPLNKRGLRDAPRMGSRLAKREDQPELIVSSPANRALTTAWMLATEIGYDPARVVVKEEIYEAESEELMDIICAFPNQSDRILLVGHNPGLTELVNQVADCRIDNMPTCGIAVVNFEAMTWAVVGQQTGRLSVFDYPKKIDH